MWKWKTVCQAARPAGVEQVDAVGAELLAASRAASAWRGLRDGLQVLGVDREQVAACSRGTTRTWPRVAGLMSMKATVRSSSATRVAGISPATILQNRQSGSAGHRRGRVIQRRAAIRSAASAEAEILLRRGGFRPRTGLRRARPAGGRSARPSRPERPGCASPRTSGPGRPWRRERGAEHLARQLEVRGDRLAGVAPARGQAVGDVKTVTSAATGSVAPGSARSRGAISGRSWTRNPSRRWCSVSAAT